MLIENSCNCRYCGAKIDYFAIITEPGVKAQIWSTTTNRRKAADYPYGNGYRVEVRCVNASCNRINSFEYDKNGNYVGEL